MPLWGGCGEPYGWGTSAMGSSNDTQGLPWGDGMATRVGDGTWDGGAVGAGGIHGHESPLAAGSDGQLQPQCTGSTGRHLGILSCSPASVPRRSHTLSPSHLPRGSCLRLPVLLGAGGSGRGCRGAVDRSRRSEPRYQRPRAGNWILQMRSGALGRSSVHNQLRCTAAPALTGTSSCHGPTALHPHGAATCHRGLVWGWDCSLLTPGRDPSSSTSQCRVSGTGSQLRHSAV